MLGDFVVTSDVRHDMGFFGLPLGGLNRIIYFKIFFKKKKRISRVILTLESRNNLYFFKGFTYILFQGLKKKKSFRESVCLRACLD